MKAVQSLALRFAVKPVGKEPMKFWSYRFVRSMPQGKAERVGGWFVVPKAR